MQIGWLMFTFTAVYAAMQLPGEVRMFAKCVGQRTATIFPRSDSGTSSIRTIVMLPSRALLL